MKKESTHDLDLRKLTALDLEQSNDLDQMLVRMAETSFGSRDLGRAWVVLKRILDDPDCGIVLTISGAMTIAKLGNIFGRLVSAAVVNAVITTGAVVTHSLVEELGFHHYQSPADIDDGELYKRGLNRIYDSIETDEGLSGAEAFALEAFAEMAPESYGSTDIIRYVSSRLSKRSQGLLRTAATHNVNIYVPALTDSELGLFLFRFASTHPSAPRYDPLVDLSAYSEWLISKQRVAFLTLGGGVPRNWAQQMLPFLKTNKLAHNVPKVVGAVRICPDSASLGHLSGSSYSEGVSWGKFDWSAREQLVDVSCDATIAFPFLARAIFNHISKRSE